MVSTPSLQNALDGRYHILGEIGRGGMGVVFRVRDRLFDRVIALKRVSFDAAALNAHDQRLRHQLANEFRLLASLWHPSIITVLDYGFGVDQDPFYIMPLIEHPRTLLEAAAPLDLRGRITLFGQLLEALDYLYRDTPRPLKRCGFLEATSAQSADGCDSRTRLKIVFRPSYFPGDRRNYA